MVETGGSPLRKRPTRLARPSAGFVLVPVIWLAGFLAAFTIAVTLSVRSHALYARNAMSGELAKGMADGLVQLVALRLSHAPGALQSDGSWQHCLWSPGTEAWVAVQDQSGLVDLNTAPRELMVAMLAGLGLSPLAAGTLAGTIRDDRDPDTIAEDGGDEPRTYPGRSDGPRNAPFEAVEELARLPGVTAPLYGQLRRLTTVSTQQAGIDFGTAPEALLQALHLSRSDPAGLPFAAPRTSQVSAITVAVRLADGTRYVRTAQVARTERPELPFAVTAWGEDGWPVALPRGDVRAVSCLDLAAGSAAGPG